MIIKLPTVELLASELARGITPVSLFDSYNDALAKIDPQPTAEDLKTIRGELRARMSFAWQAARAACLKTRAQKPV